MRHSLQIGIALLCIMTVSLAFAAPGSRIDNDHTRSTKKEITGERETPYRAPQRQYHVLFVEDPSHTGFGPATHPDPVWDGVLTEILGAGNFGWFGPTGAMSEDGPDLATLLMYELVIWNTYDDWWSDTAALTDPDLANLGDYFAGGGKVWLIGQDLLYTGVPYYWIQTYFHMDTAYEDYSYPGDSVNNLQGLAEIAGYSITARSDYQANPFFPDELVPDITVGCHTVLHDPDSVKDVGIFYPGFGEWQSAFWAIDGRVQPAAADWSEWVGMVTGMLDAFGIVPGVAEGLSKSVQRLQFNIRPVPLVQSATISFNVTTPADVELEVFNTIGQRVITLIDEYKHAGSYSVTWSGRDAKGVDVANGIYFVKLTCGDVSCTSNLVIVK